MNTIEPERHHGKLVKWDDSRGFGFIEPSDGGKNIFVHIKDIRPGERRPIIGDTVYYEIGVGNQGKPKAINAFIAGLQIVQAQPPRPSVILPKQVYDYRPQRTYNREPTFRQGYWELRSGFRLVALIFGVAVFVIMGISKVTERFNRPNTPTFHRTFPSSNVNRQFKPSAPFASESSFAPPVPESQGLIKGNINYDTGARYYHLPGMRDYGITTIDPLRGERYFRTEAEAQAAGWTRAPGE